MSRVLTSLLFTLSLYCAPVLAGKFNRIITISPSLTELVYQIKGQDKLVATVEYSFYPEAAKSLPTIGTFFSPSIETTLLYKPDLIVIDGAARNQAYEEAVKAQGIAVEVISIRSLDTLYLETERLQKIFSTHTDIKKVEKKQIQKNYTYIGFVWTNPSIILSKQTFLSSLMDYTGGSNLVDFKTDQSYLTVSDEWLMVSRPDVVFFLREELSQEEGFKSFCKRTWKNYSPKIIFLPSQKFARTTFTAIENIESVMGQVHETK